MGQFIILYRESITGNLLKKKKKRRLKTDEQLCTCSPTDRTESVFTVQKECSYLGEDCEQLLVVRQFQMFGEIAVQGCDVCLVHLPSLIIHVLHICGTTVKG